MLRTSAEKSLYLWLNPLNPVCTALDAEDGLLALPTLASIF